MNHAVMIHETANIHANARLGENVIVEPFAVIGPDVVLGDGCHVGAHAVLQGPMTLGNDNVIGPHAVLGAPPQDRGFGGEPTRLDIGSRNLIREFVTIHRATTKEDGVTRVGDDNMFMAYAHIGHDCRVGNHVTLANSANIGGHCVIEDYVTMSALCGIHHFTRIGAYAMLGGGTMTTMDIPPYAMASGNHARLYGLNRRGLQRNGFTPDEIRQVRRAYRLLFKAGLRLEEALSSIENDADLASGRVAHLVSFMRNSKRGVTR